jgi:dolichyl-phosphate-mannose--protein O-mannosyl transferase
MTDSLGAQYPQHPERQTLATSRPKEVNTAFWLWIAAVVFFLISIPVALPNEATMSQKLAQSAAAQGRQLSPAEASAMLGPMRAGIIVAFVVVALIWVFLIVKMRSGRSWARILLAVFGGLSVFSMLVQLLQGPPAPVLALTLLLVILVGAAIVLMFRPASARYFRTR